MKAYRWLSLRIFFIILIDCLLVFDLYLLIEKPETRAVQYCEIKSIRAANSLYCDGENLGVTQYSTMDGGLVKSVKSSQNYIYRIVLEINDEEDTPLFLYVMVYFGLFLLVPLILWFTTSESIQRFIFRR